MQELARQIFWNPKKLAKKDQSGCSCGMISEKANMLQKEKQGKVGGTHRNRSCKIS
jgi:hypothetical protein